MMDGQVGVIRAWPDKEYIGRIIQRYEGRKLIALNMHSDYSFPFGCDLDSPDYQIEILPPGTLLEI